MYNPQCFVRWRLTHTLLQWEKSPGSVMRWQGDSFAPCAKLSLSKETNGDFCLILDLA